MPRTAPPLHERYDIDSETGCWNFRGAPGNEGYCGIQHRGKTRKAHRVFYEELVGPIPEGLVLDHLCSNPRCVNPEHLEPVTNVVNIQRGRVATITFRDALRIRSELDRICEQYDISPSSLRAIAARETWEEAA